MAAGKWNLVLCFLRDGHIFLIVHLNVLVY